MTKGNENLSNSRIFSSNDMEYMARTQKALAREILMEGAGPTVAFVPFDHPHQLSEEQLEREKKAMESVKLPMFNILDAIHIIRDGGRVGIDPGSRGLADADYNPDESEYYAEYYLDKVTGEFREWSEEQGDLPHEFRVGMDMIENALFYEVKERFALKDVFDYLAEGGSLRNKVTGDIVSIRDDGKLKVESPEPVFRQWYVNAVALDVHALTERVWTKE